jgi:DNA-binding XRE family transcriptional regulator
MRIFLFCNSFLFYDYCDMFIKNRLEGDSHMKKIDNSECQISFGQFIKEGRKRKDMLQTEVAQLVGIPQSYYSVIEGGAKGRNIDLVLAMKICLVLGLDFNDFLKRYM